MFKTPFTIPEYSSLESDIVDIMNDESVCFSDLEKPWNGDEMQPEAMKDYWFGKKYLECALAQKILEENTTEEMLTVIDVCHQIIPSIETL